MADVHLSAGRAALTAGDWVTARREFEAALAAAPSADAVDGLGESLWWLKDPAAAIEVRTRAFGLFQREGRPREAVLTAVWLSREHRALFHADAVAQGWTARAASVATASEVGSASGWVALALAEGTPDIDAAISGTQEAARTARDHGDVDLEIAALARSGVLRVEVGHVDAGVRDIDEAMAAVTSGEPTQPQIVGQAFCALMEIATLLSDPERLGQWASAIALFRSSYDFGPLAVYGGPDATDVLSSYCGACCGGVLMVNGRLDDAEEELTASIAALATAGLHSRCVHPVTKLAELRVIQGRFEEADFLLAQYEDFEECVTPRAALELARGETQAAVERLRSGLHRLEHRPVRSFPLWRLLVDAALASADVAGAQEALNALIDITATTRSRRHAAETLFARGAVAAAQGDADAADVLREASRACSDAAMVLSACRARLARARVLVRSDRGAAVAEARAAVAGFDRLGATLDAAAAAAFLRDLGVRGRTGPKTAEVLSTREQEVLRLVAQGLSNAEIATRLFISVKTAGHHVSSILAKLQLRSRTEAAAYALVHLTESAP